jgi:DNA-binding transcriptional LysR family regulator
MIDWDDLRYFLAVHRHGNLARAGAALRINPTTVGRRVGALESSVGARLFERTPDGWRVTGAGLELVPHAERMETEARAAPHVAVFAGRYPEITLEIGCATRSVDLARREADIALRLARPEQESLVVRRLADVPMGLYASKRYVAEKGTPADPEHSLHGHQVVAFAESRAFTFENAWLDPRLDGATVALRSDSVSTLYGAIAGGLGMGLLPRVVADADDELALIPTTTSPEPRVIWQAVHEDLQHSPRIRVVLDFMVEVATPMKAAVAAVIGKREG